MANQKDGIYNDLLIINASQGKIRINGSVQKYHQRLSTEANPGQSPENIALEVGQFLQIASE